jgi:mannose-6-phosphate isomerase-like protein (cupin superfamily)
MTRWQYYQDTPEYQTKDGSIVKEILHPSRHLIKNQSLAEATVAPGQQTQAHFHLKSEEIYYVQSGHGRMTMADDSFNIQPGMAICIAPGTIHQLTNTGEEALIILCCCAPAYGHEDTILV